MNIQTMKERARAGGVMSEKIYKGDTVRHRFGHVTGVVVRECPIGYRTLKIKWESGGFSDIRENEAVLIRRAPRPFNYPRYIEEAKQRIESGIFVNWMLQKKEMEEEADRRLSFFMSRPLFIGMDLASGPDRTHITQCQKQKA